MNIVLCRLNLNYWPVQNRTFTLRIFENLYLEHINKLEIIMHIMQAEPKKALM